MLNVECSMLGSSTKSVGAFLSPGVITPVISMRSVVTSGAAFWFSHSVLGAPDAKTAVETAENAHPPPPRAFSAVLTATATTEKNPPSPRKRPHVPVRRPTLNIPHSIYDPYLGSRVKNETYLRRPPPSDQPARPLRDRRPRRRTAGLSR